MKDDKEKYAITMRINKRENDMVKELKQKYSVNISQFIRNKIIELYKTLKNKIGEEL
jgi:hypothetical protein